MKLDKRKSPAFFFALARRRLALYELLSLAEERRSVHPRNAFARPHHTLRSHGISLRVRATRTRSLALAAAFAAAAFASVTSDRFPISRTASLATFDNSAPALAFSRSHSRFVLRY